jgi:microcystin-dependent protein
VTIKTPLWVEGTGGTPTYSATDMRRQLAFCYPLPGVGEEGDLLVTQHGSGAMSVDVAAGMAIIAGTAAAGQGSYLIDTDALVTLAIAAAPGAGQSRYDLVVAKIEDADQDGGPNSDCLIEVVEGTAAATGSQVAPAAPASSLILARVLVGSSVSTILTADILDCRTFAHDKDTFIGEGKIMFGSNASLPGPGWEWADGAARSRAGFALAFAYMGTDWGVGDGSTTFNKPDLVDFFPVGAGDSYGLAGTGGEATHTLTIPEMPEHGHSNATGGQSADHYHAAQPGFDVIVQAAGADNLELGGSGTPAQSNVGNPNTGTTSNDHTHDIPLDGGGVAHNNLPPYKGVNYAICMR